MDPADSSLPSPVPADDTAQASNSAPLAPAHEGEELLAQNSFSTYELPTPIIPVPLPTAPVAPDEPSMALPVPPSIPTVSDETDAVLPIPPALMPQTTESASETVQLPQPEPLNETPAAIPYPTPPPEPAFMTPSAPPDLPIEAPVLASPPVIHPGQHYKLMPSDRPLEQPQASAITPEPAPYVPEPASQSVAQTPITEAIEPEPVTEPLASQPVGVVLPPAESQLNPINTAPKGLSALKSRLKRPGLWPKLKPWVSTAAVALLVYGVFNSQLILGQIKYFISPGASAASTSSLTGAVSASPILIIPKINLNVPVVYTVTTYDQAPIETALQNGVVHYGTTALPGQLGNNVIVGHSSNNWWVAGKYKFAFVLLSKLEVGDVFYLDYSSVRYTYQVTSKQIIEASDTAILSQTVNQPVTTLITCDPPGTSWHRLAVQAKQIDPDPNGATAGTSQSSPSQQAPLPGDGQSIFDKIRQLL